MTLLQIDLLGGFACRAAAGEPLRFATRKVRALLAYLAASAGRPQPRARLAGLLWSEHDDAQARANLRKALSRLRESLPPAARPCLGADASHVTLAGEGVAVDSLRFERLAADGTPETLERAAALYQGPLLEGFGDCGEAFEAWLGGERRRLEEILQQVLQRLLDHCVVTGAIDRAIQTALRLLALDPLQEGVHRTLMRLYLYQDRIGAALDQYRRCRDLLERELGVAPDAATERLRAELLRRLPPGGAAGRESDELPERAVVAATAGERDGRRRELPGRPSIAVLSLIDDADDAGQRHLGDGIADDIATELGRFPELDVIAPRTALAYRDARVAPEQAGAELGTAYVLEGQLRQAGERLRITVRLIETASARQLWAERYDGALAEVFEVQDDIVRRIVGTLVGRIEDARRAAAQRKRPEDWQAYDFWLRGSAALRRSDLAAIGEARHCFQQAVQRDPGFARAYVGLAMAHLSEWACFSWSHWFFLRQEALALARRAVELDERDHRAHCILALTQLYGREYQAAAAELETALALNPNDADVLAHASAALALIGDHDQAVELGQRALRLAPHHPEWYAAFVGIALFIARRHEEAIATMAPVPEALCNTPAFIAASHAHLGNLAACEGHRAMVYRHHRRQLERGSLPRAMSCLEWLLAIDPFQRPADLAHYADGLRKAGFE